MQGYYSFDCLHFKGYKPCVPRKDCRGCNEYMPWQRKILIIKLGALGDVLRTTPVLHAFRRKYPKAHITWVTKSNAKDLLASSQINRLLFVDDKDNGTILRLLNESFDEVHNYDKEDSAISLCSLVRAKEKFGFYLNDVGQMAPVNELAYYSFDLGLSDELKFDKNLKSYQQLTYESSGLEIPSSMDRYDFGIESAEIERARFLLSKFGWGPSDGVPVIGLNTGSGRVFRTKQWLESSFYELAKILHTKLGARVLLLGGVDEDERNKSLALQLEGVAVYLGANFDIREFSALISQCHLLVTGDTLAMHLSLALGVPPVVLFGATCSQEVDLYGIGEKIVSRPSCAPCYRNECNQAESMKCMSMISPMMVFEAVKRVLDSGKMSCQSQFSHHSRY